MFSRTRFYDHIYFAYICVNPNLFNFLNQICIHHIYKNMCPLIEFCDNGFEIFSFSHR